MRWRGEGDRIFNLNYPVALSSVSADAIQLYPIDSLNLNLGQGDRLSPHNACPSDHPYQHTERSIA
jgi:hypothetical protein